MKVSKLAKQTYKINSPHYYPAQTPKSVIENKQQLKTYIRVKPQLKEKSTQSIRVVNDKQIEIVVPAYSAENDRVFNYEKVFGVTATNQELFEHTMVQPIKNALSGFNSTVFIYGMTGAGKSYTMFNQIKNQQKKQQVGLVGQTISRIYNHILTEKSSKFTISLSFYEIYNENIRDLLSDHLQPLTVLEDPQKGVFINELTQVQGQNEAKALAVVHSGLQKRAINSTKSNQVSSRSHAILQLSIKKYNQNYKNEAYVQESKLFMIDLAGNQKSGQNQNKRFIEGVNINKSLLTLGKCINILSQQKKTSFIPFRDSKLTRILKDSLGGNSKTVMIACISSDISHYQQTLNTLKYSSKAKNITNTVKGTTKSITKYQVPSKYIGAVDNNMENHQQAVYSFVNSLQSILKNKSQLQRVKEDIENCLEQNEKANKEGPKNQACQQNIKELRALILQVQKKIEQLANSYELEVHMFVKNITQIIHKTATSDQPVEKKFQSNNKENKQKLRKDKSCKVQNRGTLCAQESAENKNSYNIIPVCLSQNFTNSLKNIEIDLSKPNAEKRKIRCIKIEELQINNKQNIPNNRSRPYTPQSSLRSYNSKYQHEKSSFNKRTQTSKFQISLKQGQNVESQKQSLRNSNLSLDIGLSIQNLNPRQLFGVKLKKIDKDAQKFNKQTLKSILQELDREQYDLTRVQKSMVSKIRFILKNMEEADFIKLTEKELRVQKQKSLKKL